MKSILLSLCLFSLSSIAYSQEEEQFKFSDKSDEMKVDLPDYVSDHYLGRPFTEKFYALREKYVWKPSATATTPNPALVTEKPAIYNSLRKLDKYYKKGLNKGLLSKEDIEKNLAKAVAVCYSVRYQETESLEKVLWKTKDVAEIEKISTEKIVLN